MPFKKTKMAFDVEPNTAKYRLRLARYPALARAVQQKVVDCGQQKIRLLDIGVGKGRTFRYVNKLGISENISWHGIDIRRVPSEKVAGSDRWDIKLGNIEEGLPYEDGFFDVIIAEQILEHLKAPGTALEAIFRVAKPGCLIVVGVPVFPDSLAAFRNLYIERFPGLFEKSGSGHIQSFSLKSLRKLIEQYCGDITELDARGFRIVSGGPLRWLENYKFWYDFNCWMGRHIPGLCVEVQLLLKKKASPAESVGKG